MPTFGDYETTELVEEALDRNVTVWKARKPGDGRIFCVKSVGHAAGTESNAKEEALDRDHALEFLEGVKQLKKAGSGRGRCLAPIYDFGTSPDGAWYATDFFDRNNLKSWIDRRGSADTQALRHVLYSVATGCLALKRSCGRSHGNLKSSNVFLGGRSGVPLRKTPIFLLDCYSATMMNAGGLEAADRQTANELVRDVAETQDLQALGLIILQLVEGRHVRGGYDFNYPIDRSASWDRLGKAGEHYRQLCNRLLDPHLRLEDTNLESLAKEFRPSELGAKLPLILAGAGAVCVLGAGIYFAANAVHQAGVRREAARAQRDAAYKSAMDAARAAVAKQDYAAAVAEADRALAFKPGDPDATQLRANADARLKEVAQAAERDRSFRQAMEAAQAAFDRQDFNAAVSAADRALALKANDPDATRMKTAVQARLTEIAQAAERERNYKAAMDAAGAAITRQDYTTAVREADRALAIKPNDAEAARLRNNAQTRLNEIAAAATREQNYRAAIEAAQTAMTRQDYSAAAREADRALGLKPNDADATRLKTAAQARMTEVAQAQERERSYTQAIAEARTAIERQNYNEAIAAADRALAIKANDADALRLKEDARTKAAAAALAQEQERNYRAAMDAARTALARKDYPAAISEADRAMTIKPNDAAAGGVKRDAQAGIDALAQAAERDKNYKAAMESARTAQGKQDYATTVAEAGRALGFKPGDAEATQLKTAAQARLNEIATAADREKNYKTAMDAGRGALERKDYVAAVTETGKALALKANDADATTLKATAEKALTAANLEADYAATIRAGRTALTAGQFADARQRAQAAQRLKASNHPEADQLLADIEQGEKGAQAAAQDRNYKAAMDAAQAAVAKQDFAAAIVEIGKALTLKPNDPAATALKVTAGAQGAELARYDLELKNLMVAFHVRAQGKMVPTTGATSTPLPFGNLPLDGPGGLDSYRKSADDLIAKYKGKNWLISERDQDLKAVKKAIDEWNQ